MTAGFYHRTEQMRENYRNGKKDIIKDYRADIDTLLRVTDTKYEERVYIKPIYWMDDLHEHPEKYPKLSTLHITLQKRYISYFLKEQGRLKRGTGTSHTCRANVWVLPEMVN